MNRRPPDNDRPRFELMNSLNAGNSGKKDTGFRILSWSVPVTLTVAGLMLLYGPNRARLTPGMSPGKTNQAKNAARPADSRVKPDNKLKQAQARRPLPQDYSVKLVAQSEVLVRKNLLAQLQAFQEMSRRMKSDRDSLLDAVEKRPLLPTSPKDANDTSAARALADVTPPELRADTPIDALYSYLRDYEAEIQRNHLAVSAARQALSKGLSFPEVYRAMKPGSTRMPSFDELILMQSPDAPWERDASGTAAASLSVKSTAELARYRDLLGQSVRQTGLAATRLASLFDGGRPAPPMTGQPGGTGGHGQGGGSGSSGHGGAGDAPEAVPLTAWREYAGERLDKDMVKAQALPGRRFTRSAENRGWLYINTWYIIGPWENYGRDDFALVHPPELAVDLDATYTDGQKGVGVEETDSDPIKVVGPKVTLDGVLRWKFMQSESMHNTVPVTTDHSTYYAYTEVYFDEAVSMLVAIGTDDGGRLWINGKDVWQDAGTSWYNIDEHIEPFEFRQGWNTILVRLENTGGSAAGFSLMIIPADQIPAAPASQPKK